MKFLSAADSLPIHRVAINVNESLPTIARSDERGVAFVDQSQFAEDADSTFLTGQREGYLAIGFYSATLKPGDTLTLYLASAPYELNMIEVIRYQEPVIDREPLSSPRGKNHKSASVVLPDTVPAYTARELAQYDSLKNGSYVISDSLRGTGNTSYVNFYEYLKGSIRIPESSVTHKEEGTIYMQFDIDSNGYVQNIVCVHGNCPAFAIEVAEVLARTPRIPPQTWEGSSNQKPKTMRYQLPVRLTVR